MPTDILLGKKPKTPPQKKTKPKKDQKLLKLMGVLPNSVMPHWIQCIHLHNSLAQKKSRARAYYYLTH